MGHNCIISHQSAHGAAADTGIFPLWFCSEMRIDQRFQLIDHPLHKDFARSMNPLSVKILEIIGRKLLQTLVALMIAFNTDNDQLVLPLPHKFLQSPGFTVGSILIIKKIVPIIHIHDRISRFAFLVIIRKVDMQHPVQMIWGNMYHFFNNHFHPPIT